MLVTPISFAPPTTIITSSSESDAATLLDRGTVVSIVELNPDVVKDTFGVHVTIGVVDIFHPSHQLPEKSPLVTLQ